MHLCTVVQCDEQRTMCYWKLYSMSNIQACEHNLYNLNYEDNVELDIKRSMVNWERVTHKLPLVHVEFKTVVYHEPTGSKNLGQCTWRKLAVGESGSSCTINNGRLYNSAGVSTVESLLRVQAGLLRGWLIEHTSAHPQHHLEWKA